MVVCFITGAVLSFFIFMLAVKMYVEKEPQISRMLFLGFAGIVLTVICICAAVSSAKQEQEAISHTEEQNESAYEYTLEEIIINGNQYILAEEKTTAKR